MGPSSQFQKGSAGGHLEQNTKDEVMQTERETDLFEEFFDEQVSPSWVQAPVLGRMTDVGAVNEQRQRFRLVNAAVYTAGAFH